jgi:hypothetical protein
MDLISPFPTRRLASSVKGFWSETSERPARETDMRRRREPRRAGSRGELWVRWAEFRAVDEGRGERREEKERKR